MEGFFFCCWCHVTCRLFSCLLLASVLVSCLRQVHRWSARSSLRVAFSASAVCVELTLGSCSVLLAYSMHWQSFCLGGKPPVHHGVIGVLPRPFGELPTAQCIEGIRRSAVIGLCRPLWRPLASAAEGADSLPAGQSVSAGGDTRAKRAVSEVWVGTPVPIDYPCLDGRPLSQQLPRQPSQRSRPVPRAKEKSFSEFSVCIH